MLSSCFEKGSNPNVVNFITFSGHGIIFDGDEIAVIAEYERSKEEEKK